jgi:tRNA(His) 5'-end guanylyltransferase
MVGQANFSHKELQNKSCNDIQDMLMTQKGINWNNLPTYQKRGSCCIKEHYQAENVDIKDGTCERSRWIIDKNIPVFRGEGREYIEKLVMVGE